MLVRIYVGLWIVGIIIVSMFYLTGNFTPIASVVFGFISFGLVFMGMMVVLPMTISHPSSDDDKNMLPSFIQAKLTPVFSRAREFRQSWMSENSVEIRSPRYRKS